MKGLAITFIILIAVFYAVPQDWSSPEDFGALGLTGGQVGDRIERTFDLREVRSYE